MLLKLITPGLLLLMLAACAGLPPRSAAPVRIAPNLALVLPRPADLGRSLEADQLVTAHYGTDRTIVFEGRILVTPRRFQLVALDSLGREALRIVWTDDGIVYKPAPWLPKTLHPENMLADIVLMYWPQAAVRRALAASGGVVLDRGNQREILAGGRPVIRITHLPDGADPWAGQWHYRNLAWKYALDVQSAVVAPQ